MKIFMKCHDCGKRLIFGIHTVYCHPEYDNEFLCAKCDLNPKYREIRDQNYLNCIKETLDTVKKIYIDHEY